MIPYRLNRRRVLRLLKTIGVEVDGELTVETHPQSGRNRLYLAKISGRDFAYIKQPNFAPGFVGECAAYRLLDKLDFVIRPLLNLDKLEILILPAIEGSRDLDHISRTDSLAAISALSLMGQHLNKLSELEYSQYYPERRQFISLPIPLIQQVSSTNFAIQSIVRHIQSENLITEEEVDLIRCMPTTLSHGDLKLDNILLSGKNIFLIDWELIGRAPIGWDSISCLGAMLVAWTRDARGRNAGGLGAAKLEDVIVAARPFYQSVLRYCASTTHFSLTDAHASAMLRLYLLERLCSEMAAKTVPSKVDKVMLKLVGLIKQKRGLTEFLCMA